MPGFRSLVLVTLLLPATALIACATPANNYDSPAPTAQLLTLQLNTPVKLTGDQTSVTLLAVRDSRCPTGVSCIRAGDVQADLQVTPPGGAPLAVTVGSGDGRQAPDAPSQAAGRQFCLVDLSPRPSPGEAVPPASYRLQLRVQPLQDAGAAGCETGAATR